MPMQTMPPMVFAKAVISSATAFRAYSPTAPHPVALRGSNFGQFLSGFIERQILLSFSQHSLARPVGSGPSFPENDFKIFGGLGPMMIG
jgi:hypothetical protein